MRTLKSAERDILQPIFGQTLDYGVIRIWEDHPATQWNGGRSFVLGNLIFLAARSVGCRKTLIHEAAHVWQFQAREGWRYLFLALGEQIGYSLKIADPYRYERFEGRIPFDAWTMEAQAQWIMDKERLP